MKRSMSQERIIFWVSIFSIAIAFVVMAVRYSAYHVTGSVALLSDALESVVNVVAAFIAYWAISVSAQPADSGHPFGHYKAEYLSSVFEGVLIVIAALLISYEAFHALINPHPISQPVTGLLINAVASFINAAWAWVLLYFSRLRRSQALAASAYHLFSDVLSSIGILVGLSLSVLTGWPILDPILALIVAVNILVQGWWVIRESLDGLMDKAVSDEIMVQIRQLISENADGALEVHDLRTRAAGTAIFVEFHMVVPGKMSVSESHGICDRLEQVLQKEIQNIHVLIHTEPDDRAKQQGVPVVM